MEGTDLSEGEGNAAYGEAISVVQNELAENEATVQAEEAEAVKLYIELDDAERRRGALGFETSAVNDFYGEMRSDIERSRRAQKDEWELTVSGGNEVLHAMDQERQFVSYACQIRKQFMFNRMPEDGFLTSNRVLEDVKVSTQSAQDELDVAQQKISDLTLDQSKVRSQLGSFELREIDIDTRESVIRALEKRVKTFRKIVQLQSQEKMNLDRDSFE